MIDAPASKSFKRAERSANTRGPTAASEASLATAAQVPGLANRVAPLPWLNLLCLDAPLVAVSWEWLFAHTYATPVPPAATAALFLTAWLIYLSDRFGDSLSVNPNAATSLRQRFCHRHRAAWLGAIIVVAGADLFVITTRVDAPQLKVGAAIGACALMYLLVNQRLPRVWQILPIKEVSIGCLFAAGTIVPITSDLPASVSLPWLLFACLCALNCICIAAWERDLDSAQQRISIATAFTDIERYLPAALLLVSALAVTLAVFNPHVWRIYVCVAAGAILLWFLQVFRERIQQDARTALADLVLLTPVFFLLSNVLV